MIKGAEWEVLYRMRLHMERDPRPDLRSQTRSTRMRFVILRNESGKFWWRAVGNNNEIMAASQMMERKQSCLDSIAAVQREAAKAEIVDKTDEPSS
jgi:uncharacterized protein YegP (UPF0339 family)